MISFPKSWCAASLLAALVASALLVAPAAGSATIPPITPDQALSRLMDGNQRYVSHKVTHPHESVARRNDLAGGQHPIAVVLGCADSRVPPELVFDQGLGDLFVVRVAGNIADPAVVGSLEYAVEHLSAPLILVMGHEKCGAVTAAMSGGEAAGHINSLVEAIAPVVEEAKKDAKDPLDAAVRLNVKKVVDELDHAEPILSKEVEDGRIKIVGAYYSLDTGKVTLLDAPPGVAATKH